MGQEIRIKVANHFGSLASQPLFARDFIKNRFSTASAIPQHPAQGASFFEVGTVILRESFNSGPDRVGCLPYFYSVLRDNCR